MRLRSPAQQLDITLSGRRFNARWASKRYIQIAVEKEIEGMLRELQKLLPSDTYCQVIDALASLQQQQETQQLADTDDLVSAVVREAIGSVSDE